MRFEVGSLQLTDAINPRNQVELEAHLSWKPELRQSGIAFSIEGVYDAPELC
jgi:hypothetical protein